MKWYAYPLALVAWLLVAIWIFITTWNVIGDTANPGWAWMLLAVAGAYLAISIGLSFWKRAWEFEVLLQVALVLGPLLWYLNEKAPYKPPVYVFMIDAGYEGPAKVSFTNDEKTRPQVRSTADTLYFKFNGDGTILLNEDFRTVRESIENRFYFLYPNGSRKKINIVPKGSAVAPDTVNYVAYEDTIAAPKGKINYITWQIFRADRVPVRSSH